VTVKTASVAVTPAPVTVTTAQVIVTTAPVAVTTTAPVTVTTAPVIVITTAPVAETTAPVTDTTAPVCSVCGDGRVVGNKDAIFSFPGQPLVLCGLLQNAGENGMITQKQCPLLPILIEDDCECTPAPEPSGAPVAPYAPLVTIAVTSAPVS
jgi:hypothetical protein